MKLLSNTKRFFIAWLKPINVLHGPLNIAGRSYDHAVGLRALGISAIAYCMKQSFYDYSVDIVYHKPNCFISIIQNIVCLSLLVPRVKVFHFYFGCTYLGYCGWDQLILKMLGKKIVHHFCGCDIRDYELESRLFPSGACSMCGAAKCSPNRKKMIANSQKYADLVLVSTPDLLASYPDAKYLPQAVSVREIQVQHCRLRDTYLPSPDTFIIAHAPTDRVIKGTDYLIEAVDRLILRGLDINLKLLENKSHAQILDSLSDVDVVVDQLLIGSYGTFAVEAMSLSIPVVCYLRPSSVIYYPEYPPIYNASIENIQKVLEDIYRDRFSLPSVGRACQRYAERYHDGRAVASKLASLYASI